MVPEVSGRLVKIQAKDGQRVKKGQVLFVLDASLLRAQRRQLAVQQSLAKSTLARSKSLTAEGLTTRQDLDQAESKVDELAAEIRVADVEISKTTVRAPFDGDLGLRRVSVGAWVSPTTVLSTLSDTSKLKSTSCSPNATREP